jgi:predicted transcriptional regulator
MGATREKVKKQILTHLKKKRMKSGELYRSVKCANKTFNKARQELENSGYIAKYGENNPSGGLPYKIYYIPDGKMKEVEEFLTKGKMHELAELEEPTVQQLQNLRRLVELSIQKASGSLGWVTTVNWDEKGLPVVKDPREKFPSGEELAKAIMKRFNDFIKNNCEKCIYYLIPDDEEAKFGAPIQCKYFQCELEPKAIPASYAYGCPVMKKLIFGL